MKRRSVSGSGLSRLAWALALLPAACIAPSVLDRDDRAVELADPAAEWRAGLEDDVPGTYVSTDLSGPLAAVLRMVVYRFAPDGAYTGAALLDGAPPHFEVVTGTWALGTEGLQLDGGSAATLEVAADGSLRLTGDEGRVVLRRERER